MKLKNKKTGEIHEITQAVFLSDNMNKKFAIYSESEGHNYAYKTLAELNEEWEDYEESKEYWCISENGVVGKRSYPIGIECVEQENREEMREIGNYFETEEEAEKAVEKLKAWKRLKDKGFRFGHYVTYAEDGCGKVVFKCDDIKLGFANAKDFYDDINLIFGD